MFTTEEEIDMNQPMSLFYAGPPGQKIRSEGEGQGLARGQGMGPLGVPNMSNLGLAQLTSIEKYFKWALIIGGGILAVGALALYHFKTKATELKKEESPE